jgi:hypothetical protein
MAEIHENRRKTSLAHRKSALILPHQPIGDPPKIRLHVSPFLFWLHWKSAPSPSHGRISPGLNLSLSLSLSLSLGIISSCVCVRRREEEREGKWRAGRGREEKEERREKRKEEGMLPCR